VAIGQHGFSTVSAGVDPQQTCRCSLARRPVWRSGRLGPARSEAFHRIWDFARSLRVAYDEGTDLVRDLIDATVVSFLDAQDLAKAPETVRQSVNLSSGSA